MPTLEPIIETKRMQWLLWLVNPRPFTQSRPLKYHGVRKFRQRIVSSKKNWDPDPRGEMVVSRDKFLLHSQTIPHRLCAQLFQDIGWLEWYIPCPISIVQSALICYHLLTMCLCSCSFIKDPNNHLPVTNDQKPQFWKQNEFEWIRERTAFGVPLSCHSPSAPLPGTLKEMTPAKATIYLLSLTPQ